MVFLFFDNTILNKNWYNISLSYHETYQNVFPLFLNILLLLGIQMFHTLNKYDQGLSMLYDYFLSTLIKVKITYLWYILNYKNTQYLYYQTYE